MSFFSDEVWIVGDSIIRWSAHHILVKGPDDPEFNLGLSMCNIAWKGFSGLRLSQFIERFNSIQMRCKDHPSVLVIHLGTNDLVSTPIQNIQWTIQQCLDFVYSRFPGILVVFSEVLPRVHYPGAISHDKVEKARKTLNRRVRSLLGRVGGHVIRHPSIKRESTHLFRHDGVHLSVEGLGLFLKDLQEGLRYFLLYPHLFSYPPFPAL